MNRTKSVYEELTKKMDKIAGKIHQIGEDNDLLDLSLLSSQLKGMKEDLARLLWVELPELNDKAKYEKLFNRSTGIFFSPGIFEIDAMRQAFFKRQAQLFFSTEDERQAYIDYTEKLYLGSTKTFREIKKETAQRLPGASYQEKQIRNITQFTLAMSNDSETKPEVYSIVEKRGQTMTKRIDFSSDYEELIGQLYDLVEVIDLALVDDNRKTAMATLNVIRHSLNHLITDHTANAERQYQPQEVTE